MDEASKDAVPSMGPPEPRGKLDGQNRATNLQGLSSEGLEGIVKSFGLSCDTCTNTGHWISRVRSGGACGCNSWRAAGVTLTPSLLPRSPRDAAAPAQVAPQKARAQVRQMLAARVTRHVTRAPVCTLASLPRVAAGRPHGSWHAHLPIHPSRLTPRGPAHPGTTWTSCSTSAICRSCELSCTFVRMLLCKVYSFSFLLFILIFLFHDGSASGVEVSSAWQPEPLFTLSHYRALLSLVPRARGAQTKL